MYSVQVQVSDGTLSIINLSIEYFAREDITLYRNLEIVPLVLGTDWQWDTDTRINLLTGTPVPAGESITVRRNTNKERAYNIYDGGAAFSRETLDENFRQIIYLAQEFTEGNGLTGLFFPLDMHGFKITNLGDGTLDADAINKGQLDVVGDRVSNLENSFITGTVSYPWYVETDASTDTFTPGFTFDKAAVYINGVCQVPEYSYIVTNNTVLLAEPVPEGTLVFMRLGEDVDSSTGYVTASAFAMAVATLGGRITANSDDINVLEEGKANKGANSDITSLSGLTTALSIAQGGTAATTASGALTNLGAAGSGVNTDITTLNGLTGGIKGVVTNTAAGVGIVGEQLSAVTGSAVTLTSATVANVITLVLTPGDWEVNCNLQLINSGAVTSRSFGVSTTSVTLPSNWFERYSTTANLTAGTTNIAGTTYRLNISANTTVYLVANITFAGTCTANGHIRARRMR